MSNSVHRDEPLLATVKETKRLLEIGHTKTYALIASGDLEAIKIGRMTRITYRSIKVLAAGKAAQ